MALLDKPDVNGQIGSRRTGSFLQAWIMPSYGLVVTGVEVPDRSSYAILAMVVCTVTSSLV